MLKSGIGLLIGIIGGCLFPANIIADFTKIFSVILLTASNTFFGGLKAASIGKFDDALFVSGFISNTFLALLLVYAGDCFGTDFYYAIFPVFGYGIFKNFADLRKNLMKAN